MALESRRIPMNSREVDAGNVFPGAIGIFKSVNRCKTLHKAVIQLALGGGATRKKSSKM